MEPEDTGTPGSCPKVTSERRDGRPPHKAASPTQPYTAAMDQNEAIQKARQFARTAYAGQVDAISHACQQKIQEMRAQLAARGTILSGTQVVETARINGDMIRALTVARLEAILEGYELYGVSIDDLTAVNICDEVVQGMNQMIHSSKDDTLVGLTPPTTSLYPGLLAKEVGISAGWVKTQIDRRRLSPKKAEGPSITTIYNVQGDNARWNMNSSDNSVNVVTKSSDEFFTALRGRIESEIADEVERRKILEAFTALQESHGKPSFSHRYTDFMAAAANHITVIVPFIPALTEMLHKALG
jgi:hypothetical protein